MGEGFVMRVLKRLSGVMAAVLAMMLMVGTASAATMDGYDVSNYQSGTVTRDVPGDFAIMEVTEGGFVVNPQWNEQTRYALAACRQIGLYHMLVAACLRLRPNIMPLR